MLHTRTGTPCHLSETCYVLRCPQILRVQGVDAHYNSQTHRCTRCMCMFSLAALSDHTFPAPLLHCLSLHRPRPQARGMLSGALTTPASSSPPASPSPRDNEIELLASNGDSAHRAGIWRWSQAPRHRVAARTDHAAQGHGDRDSKQRLLDSLLAPIGTAPALSVRAAAALAGPAAPAVAPWARSVGFYDVHDAREAARRPDRLNASREARESDPSVPVYGVDKRQTASTRRAKPASPTRRHPCTASTSERLASTRRAQPASPTRRRPCTAPTKVQAANGPPPRGARSPRVRPVGACTAPTNARLAHASREARKSDPSAPLYGGDKDAGVRRTRAARSPRAGAGARGGGAARRPSGAQSATVAEIAHMAGGAFGHCVASR